MFNICIHCEMITTNKLINISLKIVIMFCLWSEHIRSTLSKFQMYNRVLLTIVNRLI